MHHRFSRLLSSFAGHPVYATTTTLSGVVAGLIGSVYGGDVASAFPFGWRGPWAGISAHALIFWFALFLFAVLFYQRQRFDDAARNRLTETSNKIAELVATLPPRAFRGQYAVGPDPNRRTG
jgi:hypothetical protein